MSDSTTTVTITILANGPLLIKDPVLLVDAETGASIPIAKLPIALCRCGLSDTKPYCNGAHKGTFNGTCVRQEP